MIPALTDRERKICSAIGGSSRGDQFVALLERIQRDAANVDSIEGGDYGSQVEGRKIFKKALGTIIDALKHADGPPRKGGSNTEEYE